MTEPSVDTHAEDPAAGEVAVVPPVRVLGVRHHGPGSARAVAAALAAYDPQVVLIEGPPEADALVGYATSPDLQPPVALLAYATDEPSRASLWPLASFSPEWQAIRWAVAHHRPVRFMDLPAATVLADDPRPAGEVDAPQPGEVDEPDPSGTEETEPSEEWPDPADQVRDDPIALLAHAAGHDDPERWWEDVIEHRFEGDPFDAVAEAMSVLREDPDGPEGLRRRRSEAEELREARREAHMRKVLRAATKEFERVAVVCGAWHVPALTGKLPPATADNKTLRGLPKRKVTMTWVPWTHSRLAYRSGYGAGIDSPGWYFHLFTESDQTLVRWLTGVARVLRKHDLPVSSAHVIEAVRLAETLAVIRGRPLPGLDEVMEATLAVMCDGNRLALDLVTRDAVVGERLGTVPDTAPSMPLEADLRARARTLRLKLDPEPKELVLDLRKDNDRERSRLLQRLRIVGVPWGEEHETTGTGTFKEAWEIAWDPVYAVNVIEASLWGTTVADAAAARLVDRATSLPSVTAAVESALRADLSGALPTLLTALDHHAAQDNDVSQLLQAFGPLVRARRYGDVRGTDTGSLTEVAVALLARICAGLPAAAGGLGGEAAAELIGHVEAAHEVMALLEDPDAEAAWLATLREIIDRGDVTGLLAGRLVRLLLDADALVVDGSSHDEAERRLSRALSHGTTAPEKAAWVEGFLSGSALLLVHSVELLSILDEWLGELDEGDFVSVVPMLRRTFGAYALTERRAIADRVRRLEPVAPAEAATDVTFDPELAAGVLATVRALMGGDHE
ncbi:DUF5682 family protein [Mariniluteicoccus endophyticus]